MRRRVVRGEQILTPAVGEVAPHRVDVVGIVLRVVVLDQTARAARGGVVAVTAFLGTGPSEGDQIETGHLEPFPFARGQLGCDALDVVLHQAHESVALLAGQLCEGYTARDRRWVGAAVV